MKKKYLIVALCIAMVASFCSCKYVSMMPRYYRDFDRQIAEETIEQITKAIVRKDKVSLKEMFSKRALNEVDNFDDTLTQFFEIFQCTDISWEDNEGEVLTAESSNEYGAITRKIETWYNVSTENQKYIFHFIKWTIDTENPDNVGLYTLRIIRLEDEEKQFVWDVEQSPGIYYRPGE